MDNAWIIVPAYNEAAVLRQVVEGLLPLQHRVLVVDDGSTDNSAETLRGLPVTVLRHPVNLGQGAALETGMAYCRRNHAAYVVHFDADGQHDPCDISSLLTPLTEHRADLVLGSRFLYGRPAGVPRIKRMILPVARWLNFVITGIRLSDAHNGLRAMNRVALELIHFTQPGMAHASEILYSLKGSKLRYLEVPVNVTYSRYARKKGQGIGNAVNIMFDLIFKKN